MADKKISQLTALSAANLAPSTDVLAIVDTSATETKKIVAQDLINGVLNVASAVGIGTASPSYKLDVNGVIATGSGANRGFFYNDGSKILLESNSTYPLAFSVNGAVRATIDSSGNLGLGVTPSLWNSDYKALNIGSKGIVYGRVGSQETAIGANWYRTTAAAFVYASNGFATFYAQDSGNHTWHIAPNNTSGAGATASFTQAMTLDASGNLGVGTTSPAFKLQVIGSTQLAINAAGTQQILQLNNSDTTAGVQTSKLGFSSAGVNKCSIIGAVYGDGYMAFATNNDTERGRFTAGGYFKASNSGTYQSATGAYHELYQSVNDYGLRISSVNASLTEEVLRVDAARNTTNNTFYAIRYYNSGAAAYKFNVADSGDCTNTNGTYAAISDIKLKEDVVDAASQWDDIKNLRVRKYRLKSEPDKVQIGLVAQEAETVSPGLVDEHIDRDAEGNDLGTTTKSVKYSILYMKAVKALQEAMARIESLEAKVSALEAK